MVQRMMMIRVLVVVVRRVSVDAVIIELVWL